MGRGGAGRGSVGRGVAWRGLAMLRLDADSCGEQVEPRKTHDHDVTSIRRLLVRWRWEWNRAAAIRHAAAHARPASTLAQVTAHVQMEHRAA